MVCYMHELSMDSWPLVRSPKKSVVSNGEFKLFLVQHVFQIKRDKEGKVRVHRVG